MPPALDRLLASPSSLQLLRSLLDAPELPKACVAAVNCCHPRPLRRTYSNSLKESPDQKWRRWQKGTIKQTEPVVEVSQLRSIKSTCNSSQFELANESNHENRVSGENEDDTTDQALWAEDLARQERLHGEAGVLAVWEAHRVHRHHLPTDDTPDAAILWGTFVRHAKLVLPIIHLASVQLRETGKIYPHLYELVMEHWLPRKARWALKYHHKMVVKLRLRKLPLRRLARLGPSQFDDRQWEAFMEIYRNSNERNIYDKIVPPLIKMGSIDRARRWHTLCVLRGDSPTESIASHPTIQSFIAEDSKISGLMQSVQDPRPSETPAHKNPKYNEVFMRRLLGRDTAPIRFEDSFSARMFATRAIPPENVIKGLAMVGVNEIGPQALLAMAARTTPMSELPERFNDLKAAGISLQGCVISLALEKFALEEKWGLVTSILESDQHPDVYDDAKLQRKLLTYYLGQRDWSQVHRTLAILTLFHSDPSTASWNLLLQTQIKQIESSTIRSGLQDVIQTLQDMSVNGVMVSLSSKATIKSLLRPRQRGRKPGVSTRGKFDDLRIVSRIYMAMLERGIGQMSPTEWHEVIRRYGMLGRIRELRRLLIWLVNWYTPRGKAQVNSLTKSSSPDNAPATTQTADLVLGSSFHPAVKKPQYTPEDHTVRTLIPPSLQQAIIIWGFRAGLLPNSPLEQSMLVSPASKKHFRRRFLQKHILNRLDWNIGLKIIVQLREFGVQIHRHTIIKALQSQFIVMFGRGHSNKMENRIMERNNKKPYTEYVRKVNKIWGEPLFAEPWLMHHSRLHSQMWHPRLARRTQRKTRLSIHEILCPGWQERQGDGDGEGHGDSSAKGEP